MRKEKDELIMEEGVNYLCISLGERQYQGHHFGQECYDDNSIEVYYREEDDDGWGAGGSEYISTHDIRSMADSIRQVLHRKTSETHYETENDLMRISIRYDDLTDRYFFSVGLLETLMREYHITVEKSNLHISELEEYITPFFEWERQHPIVKT